MGEYAKPRRANVIPASTPQVFPAHSGRRFLVTGATGGIGSALAQLLLSQGARLVLADLDLEQTRALAQQLGGDPEQVRAVRLDLTDPTSISDAVQEAVDAYDGLDGLANVAGVVQLAPAIDHTREIWADQFEINVLGPFEVARQVAAHLIQQDRGGAIVNVSSVAGKAGHNDMVAYNASKAAIISWTKSAAHEWSQFSINVNCVCPSAVDTPMLHQVALDHENETEDDLETIFGVMAPEQLGRLVTPLETAAVVSQLLDAQNQAIRGQSINVDGGTTPY